MVFTVPNSAKVNNLQDRNEIMGKRLQCVTTISLDATTEVTLTLGYKDEKQPNHILHI